MEFPYGKAPLFILLLSVFSALALLATGHSGTEETPDLTFTVFARTHYEAYQTIIPEFETAHNVRIEMQLVDLRVLESRLRAALLSGSPVPDVVELENGAMGFFTKGPIEDVGFVDLTELIKSEKLDRRMVASRFSLWESRGHIFGLPHDVHPVVLAYRRDIVEQLGIDVDQLTTWDRFVEVARDVITKDVDGDGEIDRFALDLATSGENHLELLLRQRGGGLFDDRGNLTMYSDDLVDMMVWYIHQTRGPDRISFPAGWGQALAKAMNDGFVLFYFAPDWRTKSFELEVPKLAGKMAIMPLPAWEEGGCRTSTWGGTGLCITKACADRDLAWQFAKFLYLHKENLGRNFNKFNILPPLRDAWNLPELAEPNPFYSGQVIGSLFAELGPGIPPEYSSPYSEVARSKLVEAFVNSGLYYENHGDDGLRAYVDRELKRCSDYVQRNIDSNKFFANAN